MTQEELNYIKNSFSQILDDIGGNPDWYDAAKAVASDLGTMEKQLEERVTKLPSNLDEAAQKVEDYYDVGEEHGYLYCHRGDIKDAFIAGAEWMAGQGINLPAHIFIPSGFKSIYDYSKGEYPAAVHLDCGGSLILEKRLQNFNHNEEVIVQIRKK